MTKNMIWALAVTGMVACLARGAAANELRFSDLDQRMKSVERQLDEREGVRAAAFQEMNEVEVEADAAPIGSIPDPAPESDSEVVCHKGGDACGGHGCGNACGNGCEPCCGSYYAEAQVLMIRPHVNEDWVGKLSESHKLSTRYILGYEDCCGLGTRLRYWHFDHTIVVLDPAQIGMGVETVDAEVTNHVCFRSTDVVLGGGFRYSNWELADDDGDDVKLKAYGLTMAADARTPLSVSCGRQLSLVYGGRMSILGGDWHGDNDIIDTIVADEIRDDNVFVTELSVGLEYMFRNMFARGMIEMQNWRSDVLAEPGIGNGIAPQSIGSTNSIGFVGLGFHVGAAF